METIDVFVYGTLKPGGTYHQQYCAPYLQTVRLAQVRGLLYDLPLLGYPAMTLSDGWVKGYWFRLDAAAMPGLDYLEGYSPDGSDDDETFLGDRADQDSMGDNNTGVDSADKDTVIEKDDFEDDFEEEYIRQRTTVFDLSGQPIGEAWIYVMAHPPLGAVLLAEGEWNPGCLDPKV